MAPPSPSSRAAERRGDLAQAGGTTEDEIPVDGSWRRCSLHGATVGIAILDVPSAEAVDTAAHPPQPGRPLSWRHYRVEIAVSTEAGGRSALAAGLTLEPDARRPYTLRSMSWLGETSEISPAVARC